MIMDKKTFRMNVSQGVRAAQLCPNDGRGGAWHLTFTLSPAPAVSDRRRINQNIIYLITFLN